jgi:cytochrome c553
MIFKNIAKIALAVSLLGTAVYAEEPQESSEEAVGAIYLKLEGEAAKAIVEILKQHYGDIKPLKVLPTATVEGKTQKTRAYYTTKGEGVYKKTCSVCHGDKGQTRAYGVSRPLNSLTYNQFHSRLRAFQQGEVTTTTSSIMTPYAETVIDTEDQKSIWNYLQSLKGSK